jgi:thioredoxin reductase (NADPH)
LKKSEVVDAVVIGGGPAGISASIQLKRLGLHPLLIEKEKLGGSLLNANLVENYLGFPKGIRGSDLVELIREQFKLNDVKTLFSEVTTITKKGVYFEVSTDNHKIYAKTVVVATGSIPKRIGLSMEEELYAAKKLFYEIKEIPSTIHNRIFTIIGGGDAAFDYSLSLSKKNNRVNIVCRGKPRCLRVLLQRAKQDNNIKLSTNTKVVNIQNEKDKITLMCEGGDKLISDYVIVAIGKTPNIEILDSAIRNKVSIKSSGLVIVGDAKRDSFRHLGIAVGDGLLAAMQIKKHLDD